MVRLILIRHGETDYNLQRKYCGFSNPSLNKEGIWQSEKLRNRLKRIKIDRIYSSDLKRAIQSANIIFKNAAIETTPDFREMNFGIFESLTYEEIMIKHNKVYDGWMKKPTKVTIPDGENLNEFATRVRNNFYKVLKKNNDKKIALITHEGPIRIILCDALKSDLKNFWKVKQDLGAFSVIDYSDGLLPVIIKMNETSHLSSNQ